MLEKGARLAGYRIDGIIGQGGMGVVYTATQLALERTVALKVLADSLGRDQAFRERFRREGRLQAAIDHPHIVTVYEAGESRQGLFLAMRLVHGPNLKELILGGELDPERALRLLSDVADALETAHEAGLVHRDIKPQNILVGPRDHAYLADFGLTKPVGATGLTRTGQFVGTLDYIAPEQIRGETPSARSDVYSFAAVLYECLTGSVPYPKESDAAVLYSHISDPPPLVTEKRPALPKALDGLIARAMAKDPEERHPSAVELIADARSALETLETELAPRAETDAPQATRAPKRLDAVVTAPPAPPPETRPAPRPATVPHRNTLRSPPAVTVPADGAGELAASTAPAAIPGRQPRARPLRAAVAVSLVLAGALATGGFLAAQARTSEPRQPLAEAPPQMRTASAGGLTLTFQDPWRPVEASRLSLPGLDFSEAIALAPQGAAGDTGLVAGQMDASHPTLLPASFRQRLVEEPARDDSVRLGDLAAYRYQGLEPDGFDGTVTLYVVPTTEGTATVACSAARAGSKALGDCERIAATLALESAEAYSLGPSAEYAQTLNGILRALNSSRVSRRKQLARAETPTAQAQAADRLAAAYRTAARRLGKLVLTPEAESAHRDIVKSLERARAAYGNLATAARRGDGDGFRSARRGVLRAEDAARSAMAALAALGYSS